MKKRLKLLAGFITSKQMLFTICFIAFNLLDFLRDTQNGDVWAVAVNCTGLVMLVVIGSAYSVRDFLTPFTYIWSLLSSVVAGGLLLIGRERIYDIYVWVWVTAVMNIWWIGIFVWYLLRKAIKSNIFQWTFIRENLSIRNTLGWSWILLTILMMFSNAGRIWPVWFLFMFGIFYITCYQEEDRKALMEGMINGTILSFFCIQIYAYGFRPYDIVRYKGAFTNPNIAALHYLIIYAFVLFKLHTLELRGARKVRMLFYMVLAGGLLGFQFMTMGRTAWIASIILTFLYGLFVVKKVWQKNWRGLVLWWSSIVLSMVITFPAVFGTVRWLPTILHHPIWYESEGYSTDWVHSFDAYDSEKYVEWDEFIDVAMGRILKTLGFVKIDNPLVLQVKAAETNRTIEKVGSQDMDESLRIRLSIYKAYIEDLNWTGHSVNEGRYQLEDTDYASWHAQNLWLQIAYYFGIPSGILFILITILMLSKHIKTMNYNPEDPYAIIPFFLCVVYFAFGIMEVVWNPGQLILLLFIFVQHPMAGTSGKGKRCTFTPCK